MDLFFQQTMTLPTVVFTAVLAVIFVYWLFVILGALDLDMLDVGGDLDGAAEGLDGAGEGSAEAAGGSVGDGLSLMSFLTWLGWRNAPFTVVFSLATLVAWTTSMLGNQYLAPILGGGSVAGAVVAALAVAVAASTAGVFARPLSPLFKTHAAEGRRDLVGRTCIIETGSVDEKFGVATVPEGGRWPRIEVRAAANNPLTRGAQALIIDYDESSETFRVEPLTPADRSGA